MVSLADTGLRARDGALIENWYVACLSRELKPGRALHRIIYDRPYALYRDTDGRAVAFPDRCLHRGALLSEGRVEKNCLVCPYHGWRYDASGQVVAIPSEGPDAKAPPSGLRLGAVPCVEQDECVWVWTGESAPLMPAPPFRFPHFTEAGWSHYFMITDFDNEVTHLAENFMDVPHTVFVHAGWFRSAAAKKVPIKVETREGSVLVTYEQPQDEIGFTNWFLNPKREPMIHTDHFILPNLTKVDYHFGSSRSFVIISQCTPVSTLKSRVYTAIIFRMGALVTPLMKPFLRFYTRRVIEQDVDIMRNQGRSFRFDLEPAFRSTDADIVHIAIERLRDMARKGETEAARKFEQNLEKTIWI